MHEFGNEVTGLRRKEGSRGECERVRIRQLSSHSRNESSILADVHAYCFFKIGDHPSLLSWTYDSLVQAIYKAVDHSILLPRAFSLPPFHGSCYARVNTLFCSTYPRNFRNSSLFNLFPARGRHGAPARDSDSDPDSSPVFIIRRCRRRAHIFLSFLVLLFFSLSPSFAIFSSPVFVPSPKERYTHTYLRNCNCGGFYYYPHLRFDLEVSILNIDRHRPVETIRT